MKNIYYNKMSRSYTDPVTLKYTLSRLHLTSRNRIVQQFLDQYDEFLRQTTSFEDIIRLLQFQAVDFDRPDYQQRMTSHIIIINRLLDANLIPPNQIYTIRTDYDYEYIATPFGLFLRVRRRDIKLYELMLETLYKFIEKGALFVIAKEDIDNSFLGNEDYREPLNDFIENYTVDIITEFLENGDIKQEWLNFYDNSSLFYSVIATAVHNKDVRVVATVLDHGAICSPLDLGLKDSLHDVCLCEFMEKK